MRSKINLKQNIYYNLAHEAVKYLIAYFMGSKASEVDPST